MTDFAVFDWPFLIEHFSVTKGYRDQGTSEWVPGSRAPSPITGNFDSSPIAGEMHDVTGTIAVGQTSLYTSASLKQHDRIRVHLDSSGNNYVEYTVDAVTHDFAWLEQFAGPDDRTQYALVRAGGDNGQ